METKIKIAIVGCGNISDIYLKNCLAFGLDVVACTDMDMSRAEAKAQQFGVAARPLNEVLADSSIELILNLTPPGVHAEVSYAALNAGKHVYSEKPLATNRIDGAQLLELAKHKGLRIGCAPDTFLGGGLQTCRKLLDDGAIGEPVAAVAFVAGHGMEMWHPNPDFFYQPGAGPMFDVGPYYLTALVSMLGPVRRLTGSARISFPERLISSQPLAGTKIKVNTPTHVTGVLDFVGGSVATVITSFDVWAANLPCIEIYGSEGSLSVPDPNTFGGSVRVKSAKDEEWRDVQLTHGHTENSRGLGVSDMVAAIRENRPHRANGEMAFHVLDLMQSFEEASISGQHIEIQSRCERPAALEDFRISRTRKDYVYGDSMTSPVRVALIGVGGMARYHIGQMLKMQSTTRIVALCEPSEVMALEAAKVFVDAGLPPPPNQPDWQKLIAEYGAELDAVFIITPHALHHDQTKACLEAGIDVLLEKPMVMTAAEAHSLIETRDRTGRLLVVAFQGSLSPQVRLASRLLRANEFGRILSISGIVWQNWGPNTVNTWRQEPSLSGGGFLFDTGAHLLNTVADLAGEGFSEVSAWFVQNGRPVETLAVAMGRLASGGLVTFHACGEAIPSCSSEIRVFCEKAILHTGMWGETLAVQYAGDEPLAPIPVPPSLGVWEQFLAVRSGRIPNPSPPEVGLRMAKLWDAIRASAAKNGMPVKCEENYDS